MSARSASPGSRNGRPGEAERVRLNKLMASRGLCSRREADRLVSRGLVRIDGEPATHPGQQVDPASRITLDPLARREQQRLPTVLLNKPVGFVSGQPEHGYPPAVSLITDANHHGAARRAGRAPRRGLAPAGRLDIDSRGLLVLTADGRLARRLIAPGSTVEKEYLVHVAGGVTDRSLAQLRHGLVLDGRALREAHVDVLRPGLLRFVLREGRKRQIRRMCELVNLQVTGLTRVRIGGVRLGGLPEGRWRWLMPGEHF